MLRYRWNAIRRFVSIRNFSCLTYKFSEEDFISECAVRLSRERTTLFQDIYESLCHVLDSPLDKQGLITKIKHRYEVDSYDSHLSLNDYITKGFFDLNYPRIDIYSAKDTPIVIREVKLPSFMLLESFQYANGSKTIKVKQHSQRTQNKITIELLHVKIPSKTLRKIKKKVEQSGSHLLPSKLGGSEWRQTFYSKVSGESYFCECFKVAIEKNHWPLLTVSHPHLAHAIKRHAFKKSICHLCTDTNSNLFFSGYGSPFYEKYGAYINKIAIEKSIDIRDAENIVREIKGVAKIGEKWVNETLLFNYIDTMFPDFTVEREASPSWLGKQRIDIYIPALKLAVEYQGQQHFMPIKFFGGEEGFQKAKVRDQEKLVRCKNNGVDLVYFTYKEDLSENLVTTRLKKYISIVTNS